MVSRVCFYRRDGFDKSIFVRMPEWIKYESLCACECFVSCVIADLILFCIYVTPLKIVDYEMSILNYRGYFILCLRFYVDVFFFFFALYGDVGGLSCPSQLLLLPHSLSISGVRSGHTPCFSAPCSLQCCSRCSALMAKIDVWFT